MAVGWIASCDQLGTKLPWVDLIHNTRKWEWKWDWSQKFHEPAAAEGTVDCRVHIKLLICNFKSLFKSLITMQSLFFSFCACLKASIFSKYVWRPLRAARCRYRRNEFTKSLIFLIFYILFRNTSSWYNLIFCFCAESWLMHLLNEWINKWKEMQF